MLLTLQPAEPQHHRKPLLKSTLLLYANEATIDKQNDKELWITSDF